MAGRHDSIAHGADRRRAVIPASAADVLKPAPRTVVSIHGENRLSLIQVLCGPPKQRLGPIAHGDLAENVLDMPLTVSTLISKERPISLLLRPKATCRKTWVSRCVRGTSSSSMTWRTFIAPATRRNSPAREGDSPAAAAMIVEIRSSRLAPLRT